MGKSILFVDDERAILKSLERLFFDTDYEVFLAESGEEGLRILAENRVGIVVSDMRMPTMNGHEFLRRVKEKYPETTRIVLSGYANEREMVESIVDGSHGLYLLKPWKNEDLVEKIAHIFSARELYRSLSMLEFVNRLDNFSILPNVYTSVSRMIEQDAEISEIAGVIETDPAIAASVLRVVNSAFYKIKTGSIVQAITYLGLAEIKAIVLSSSLLQAVHIQVAPFTTANLAMHSNRTNMLMLAIYDKILGRRVPEQAAAAGLLHNIGFFMFLHYFPAEYRRILKSFSESGEKVEIAALEKECFNISHGQLGGYLLDWWGLPYTIVECALFHTTPMHEAVIDRQAVAAVHVASNYAWKSVLPKIHHVLNPAVFDLLGTTQQHFELVIKDEVRGELK